MYIFKLNKIFINMNNQISQSNMNNQISQSNMNNQISQSNISIINIINSNINYTNQFRQNSQNSQNNQNRQKIDINKIKNIYNYKEISEYNKWKGSILEYVVKNINISETNYANWKYKSLIKNKNISLKFIEENIDKFYPYLHFSVYNHNITVDFFSKYLNNNFPEEDKIYSLFKKKYIFSSNVNLDNMYYEPYNELFQIYNLFNMDGLSSNSTITPEFIVNNYDKLNIYNLLHNKEILINDFDLIYNLFKGEMTLISYNHNITINMIKENHNLNWNYFLLHMSVYVNEEFIEENIDKNWNWSALSKNNNISFEFILKHKNKNWNWSFISKRITFDKVISNLYLNWDWTNLTINPNITMEDIENNLNLPWNLWVIAENPNINIYMIQKYISYINFDELAINEFSYNPIVYEKNLKKDIIIRQKIVYNVLYKYINKDYANLISKFCYYN